MAFNQEAALQYLSNSPGETTSDEEAVPGESEVLHGRAAEELMESHALSRLVRAYAPMAECLVMEAAQAPSVPLSRDQLPSWTNLRKNCGTEAAQCMRLLSALSLKSCRCPPKLTKTRDGVVVVFTGHGKSAAGSAVIFDPGMGAEEHMDLDMAAKSLSEVGTNFDIELQEKEVLEGIIVCLDVSDSMCKHSSFERDEETGLGEENHEIEQDPSDDSTEALQRHLRRFAALPEMAHIRQIIQQRTTSRDQANFANVVLEDLSSLARVAPRGSVDDARRLVKYKSAFAKVLLEHADDDPPPEFCCPITRSLMTHAVCAPDGFTYESDAITAWFSKAQTSPMTGQRLTDTTLFPNQVLRSQIQDWRDCHPAPKEPAIPTVSEQERLRVVCYMPHSYQSYTSEMVELELPAPATAATVKQKLRTILGVATSHLVVYHAGNLLPELLELRRAGVTDGSPLEMFTFSPLAQTCHRNKKVRVVLVRQGLSGSVMQLEVGACELILSLKCRIWSLLPQSQQLSSGPSHMDLWFNLQQVAWTVSSEICGRVLSFVMFVSCTISVTHVLAWAHVVPLFHEVGDGFRSGTLLSDDRCVGDYVDCADEIMLESDLHRQGREKIRRAKARGRYLDRITVSQLHQIMGS